VGKYRAGERAASSQRGVVYALAPSPLDANVVWAGTDDGLIHLTRDGGKSWTEVTPPQLSPWAKVSIIDAGHFDAQTAYAAINTFRLDQMKPLILRTRDGGKRWAPIVEGLPEDAPVNVVREDPRRRGLLYAGTERAVHVSFDDGGHWQPLRLAMPATSIRDLIVKDDDLAIATHGRGFWILDDVSPLRELSSAVLAQPAQLLRPAEAVRARWNTNTDTPLPLDEPSSPNGPDGAVIDYWLREAVEGPVVLEVLDEQGALVRRISSADPVRPLRDEGNVPRWWIRADARLQTRPGLHRFVWDLRYPEAAALEPFVPMAAALGDTPREPRGPWVLPGRYTLRLKAGASVTEQPLSVRMDPRVKVPMEDLRRQLELSLKLASASRETIEARTESQQLRASLKGAPELAKKLAVLEGTSEEDAPPPRRGQRPPASLARANDRLVAMLQTLQQVDAAPTAAQAAVADGVLREAAEAVAAWRALRLEAVQRAP
jgi:hypothetical protein